MVAIPTLKTTPNPFEVKKPTPVLAPKVTPTGVGPTIANATNLAKANTPVTIPTVKDPLAKFGGQDEYIKKQLDRFKTGNATLQGKINTDLARFGQTAQPITGRPDTPGFYSSTLTGATLGTENGQSYFQLPDGSREWVDTPEELEIANNLGGLQSQLSGLEGQQDALIGQNLYDYNQALQGLTSNEAVDRQSAQELQNRRGGFYSGGLDYQLGNIGSSYATQRGDLAQDLNTRNSQLRAQYGSQADTIRSNIANLLSTAPGQITQAVDAAVAAKAKAEQEKQAANVKAAEDFTKTTGYIVNPQEDYSGFWRQVEAGAPLTPERQLAKDKQDADIAAAQEKALATATQQELSNLWKQAEITGYIPDKLADIYGRPHGEQTQKTKQWADEQGLRKDNSDLAWLKEKRAQTEAESKTPDGEKPNYVPASVAGDTLKESLMVDTTVNGKPKRAATTDATVREQTFVELANSGLVNPAEMANVLLRGGYSQKEVNALKAAYPQAFQGASTMSGNGSSVNLSSGVAGNASLIDSYANKYGVDPALVKAIIYHETGNLTSNAAKNKFNFGGIMGSGGLRTFNSAEEGIEAVAKLLGTGRYKGKSIAQIGAIYAPVGASNDPNNLNSNWVKNVTNLYNKFK